MKEPLLMIPGTLCDAQLFAPQRERLSRLATCKVVSAHSSDKLKEVASRIVEEVEGPFSLMGLSYGAIIAFEIWRQAAKRIKRLILLNTNHKLPSETTRINQQRFVGMAFLGEFEKITSDILIDAMLHPDHARQERLRKTVLDMALNVGKEAFFRQVKAQLGRPDSTPDLPRITCPTLIIAGEQDRVCPVELHREMAQLIPRSELNVIPQCGHLSTLEQPEAVAQAIESWWQKTTKACEKTN